MNDFSQNWIFIHRTEFLSTPTYFCPWNHNITTWWQFIVCVPFPDDREPRIMHLQASCELFSTESNFYPQSSIFIHISYNSYPQVRNLIQVFTNQISVQTVIIVGDWKILINEMRVLGEYEAIMGFSRLCVFPEFHDIFEFENMNFYQQTLSSVTSWWSNVFPHHFFYVKRISISYAGKPTRG